MSKYWASETKCLSKIDQRIEDDDDDKKKTWWQKGKVSSKRDVLIIV